MHTVAETWDDARNICLSEFSHLLVLNSMEEVAFIMGIWTSNPDVIGSIDKRFIHLGLREITDNIYVTDCGKNFHTL
jgi:hypothetical protein